MNKFISILRGINVSGQKKILMADLKALYEALGFKNVITYIQSGNVIFECPSQDKTDIKSKIDRTIEVRYDFQVPVEVRTELEFKTILENCPFEHIDLDRDGAKVLVTFLSAKPSADNLTEAQKYVASSEKMALHDQVVYLHCPNGYGRSKLSNTFLEKKLGVVATTRNLKTVSKLYALTRP